MSSEEGEITSLSEEENIVVAIAENSARELCLAKMSSSHGGSLEIFVSPIPTPMLRLLNTLAVIDPNEIF